MRSTKEKGIDFLFFECTFISKTKHYTTKGLLFDKNLKVIQSYGKMIGQLFNEFVFVEFF